MIVYVDLEHERLRQDPAVADENMARRLRAKYRLEDISGQPCLIVRYNRLSPDVLRDVQARAVVVSGCDTDFEHYAEADLAGLRAVYRSAAWPTLGFCGGLQLMAQTYGAPIDAMAPLAPGENDPYQGAYVPGFQQERLPLFGTQFHPEQYDDAHPAGRRLLENFFRLAGIPS